MLALVQLWLQKLDHHSQTTHTEISELSFLLLSLFLFLETQLPHIVTMFSAHGSLAVDQLKGHLVRFAVKYVVDQRIPAGRLPTS